MLTPNRIAVDNNNNNNRDEGSRWAWLLIFSSGGLLARMLRAAGLEEEGFGFGAEVEEEVDGAEVGEEAEAGVEDLGIGGEVRIEN